MVIQNTGAAIFPIAMSEALVWRKQLRTASGLITVKKTKNIGLFDKKGRKS